MFGNNEKIVIGYDLSDEYAQISYCMENEDAPQTLSLVEGVEQYNIPVCLFKRSEVNQWFFGKEALNYERVEAGTLLTGLLPKALAGDEIAVENEVFHPVALLALYIKRSLSLMAPLGKKDRLSAIMFTVPELDNHIIEVLNEVAVLLDLKECKIAFQGREESIYHYMIHQPMKLWGYDVMIYDLTRETMESFLFTRNQNTTPQVVFIERGEHPQVVKVETPQNDVAFLEVIQEGMEGRICSSAYLIGDGFMGNWCVESIKELCRNRRAFKGNNLYSRGACYAMLSKLKESPIDKKIIYLGKDKLKANVGMHVKREGKDSYLALLNGGDNWYESSKECDIMLMEGNSFRMIITPLDGRNVKNVEVVLDGLPIREEGATRLHLKVAMVTEEILEIVLTDMGLGELVPGTGQVFEQQIHLT